MVSAILLRDKHDSIAIGKVQRVVGKRRKRVVSFMAAVPQLMSLSRLGIGKPQAPRADTHRNDRLVVLLARRANEHDLAAIRRPARREIPVQAGCNIANTLGREIEDRDETVILAVGSKGNVLTVRRPLGSRFIATQLR